MGYSVVLYAMSANWTGDVDNPMVNIGIRVCMAMFGLRDNRGAWYLLIGVLGALAGGILGAILYRVFIANYYERRIIEGKGPPVPIGTVIHGDPSKYYKSH